MSIFPGKRDCEDQAGEHAVEDRGVPPVRGAAEEQEAAWQGRREVSATSECYDFFYLVTVHYFNGRLAEAQGIKKFDPRMSFQPKTDKKPTYLQYIFLKYEM